MLGTDSHWALQSESSSASNAGPGPGARVKHQRKYFSTLQKSGGALPRGLTMGVEFGCIYARFVLAFGKVD